MTFQRIANLPKYVLFVPYRYSKPLYVGVPGEDESITDQQWSIICTQRALDSCEKLSLFLQTYKLHEVIETQYHVQCDRSFNQLYQMHIIQGISYNSDEESQMGTGTIYACSRYNKNDRSSDSNKPRYDFVFIKYECIQEPVLVRVLMFIEISQLQQTIDEENTEMIVLLVQKLIKKVLKSDCILGDTYEFAADPTNVMQFNFDIVPVQSIVRPAFVVPVFTKGYNQLNHSASDRFRVLDRMFFDRSGWQSTFNPSSDGLETAAQRESYIKEHQTGNRIFRNNNTLVSGTTQDNDFEDVEDDSIYDSDNDDI